MGAASFFRRIRPTVRMIQGRCGHAFAEGKQEKGCMALGQGRDK